MRILAFVDLHGILPAMKRIQASTARHKPDVIICAGDFTVFEHHFSEMGRWLDRLGRNVLVIHGNHETEARTRALCKHSKNLTFIHKKIVSINGVTFAGHGGGGFSPRDPDFTEFIKRNQDKLKEDFILVTHAPPYGTALDKLPFGHVGCKSYADAIAKLPCKLAISGHIHETAGTMGRLGKAVLINPGPTGKVIEL